jgi:hypothetical protein
MTSFVTTDTLILLLKKAYALCKVTEAAQRIGSDLDADKANIKAAHELIDRGQKRLRKGGLTKKQRAKIQRQIEYNHELLACTEAECEQKVPEFSEAIAQVESVLRDIAEIHEDLSNVPRFEHAERSFPRKLKTVISCGVEGS